MRPSTIERALREGIHTLRKLRGSGSSPALDAEVLLAHALAVPREKLVTQADAPIAAPAHRRYRSLLARRLLHEPVAYLIGEKEFFGLRFLVRRGACLIPRPETETLVERAITLLKPYALHPTPYSLVVDVGTGSGAIAIAIAKSVPGIRVLATDVSAAALAVAKRNAHLHGVTKRIDFKKTDLIPSAKYQIPNTNTIILANLPYIPTAEWCRLPPEIRRHEPRGALDGGHDGLDLYRKLLGQIKDRGIASFTLLAEIDPRQRQSFQKIARARWSNAKVRFHKDLAGRIRVAEVTSREA